MFFTNYDSRKGARAAPPTRTRAWCSPGSPLQRQVVVCGAVERVDRARDRGLLRQPAARRAARRLGQPAVARCCADRAALEARVRRPSSGGSPDGRGAGAAALGRAAGGAGDGRVLAGPAEPAARPAAVPAVGRQVDRRAARAVTGSRSDVWSRHDRRRVPPRRPIASTRLGTVDDRRRRPARPSWSRSAAGCGPTGADGTISSTGIARTRSAPAAAGQVLAPWPNRIRDGAVHVRRRPAEQLPLNEPARHNAIHGLVNWVALAAVAATPATP